MHKSQNNVVQYIFKCAVICFCSFCYLSVSCYLALLSQQLSPYDVFFPQHILRVRRVKTAYCKMQLDSEGHFDIFGILHWTHYILGQTKSSPGI